MTSKDFDDDDDAETKPRSLGLKRLKSTKIEDMDRVTTLTKEFNQQLSMNIPLIAKFARAAQI